MTFQLAPVDTEDTNINIANLLYTESYTWLSTLLKIYIAPPTWLLTLGHMPMEALHARWLLTMIPIFGIALIATLKM